MATLMAFGVEIDAMIDLIRSAPYDTALLVVTLIYSIAVFRLFREASDRDHTSAARIERWRVRLAEEARERQKARPAPAA